MHTPQIIQYGTLQRVTKMYLLSGALVLSGLMLCPALFPYRWNTSASVPIGLYRVQYGQPEAGALVAFCLPKDIALYAKGRGYIGFGFSCPGWTQELLKPIGAVAGDVVGIAPEGVTVRGIFHTNTRVFEADSEGREHHVWIETGSHVVPEGYVFFLSEYHPRSWDSRYFGFVETKNLAAMMEPVWTW